MTPQTKILTGSLVAIVLLILGGTYYMSTKDKYEPSQDQSQTQNPGAVLPKNAVMITAKHSFKNGKHIIAGEVDVPTPCHSLSVETLIAESFPEQVTLVFKTTSEAEVCAQVVSARRFKIEFNADEKATLSATWNGEQAILNLIPVGPNEDLETFDIYIKG